MLVITVVQYLLENIKDGLIIGFLRSGGKYVMHIQDKNKFNSKWLNWVQYDANTARVQFFVCDYIKII